MTDDFNLPEELFDDEDFQTEAGVAAVPEYEVATLMLTGGNRIYLPIARDDDANIVQQSIMEAALQAGLTIPENTQFWVDGTIVEPNTTFIAPGMNIVGVGNIKGG